MAFKKLENQDLTLENLTKLVEQAAKQNMAIVPTQKNGQKGILEFSPQLISQQTKTDGGMSLDMAKDTNPTTGYAVACYPQLGTWIEAGTDDKTANKLIKQFITRNASTLMKNNNVLGTWLSDSPETNGMIALDISKIVYDKEEAIRLGMIHNQQAIFCLDDFSDIPCNGTGYKGRPIMESECTETHMPNPMQPKQSTKAEQLDNDQYG